MDDDKKLKKSAVWDRVIAYGALPLLLVIGICTLVLPGKDFSDRERRALAGLKAPESLTEWTFNNDLETYLSDHLPGRDTLVSVNAVYNVATGRGSQLGAWIAGNSLVEKPVDADAETLCRTRDNLIRMAEKYGVSCAFITPPTHGEVLADRMGPLSQTLFEEERAAYTALTDDPRFVKLQPLFEGEKDLYYLTDHHWTLEGAYAAYEAYCGQTGLTAAAMDAFTITEYTGFRGTTASRSGLPVSVSDTIRAAEPKTSVKVTFDGETYDHVIFPGRAETYDMYAVYLDGNHGVTVLENENAENGTLFVMKDSFANSLLPFLMMNYKRIVAVDTRYLPASVTIGDVLGAEETIDSMLFIYSLDSYDDTSLNRALVMLNRSAGTN